MAKLTDKQKRFVDEYLIDLNATQAVLRAGYKTKYPDKVGSELLGKTRVLEHLNKRMWDREKRTEITQDKVLQELAKIAFSSASDVAEVETNEEGYQFVRVKNTGSLPDNIKSIIASIKQTKYGISVETYNKIQALELIGKHLGMFKDKLELSGSMNVNNPFEGLTTEELRKLAGSKMYEC
jgi:phage terminase small subunit